MSRYELAEIAERCDGTIVGVHDGPTLVIRRGRFLVAETQALREQGVVVIDAAELAEMQESHDAVHRPESLRKACRRAVEGSNGRRLVLPPRDPAQRLQEAARKGGLVTRNGHGAA